MVTNVTSLLKTVKAVEDEHTRGTRALESTVEAIAQEIRALNSGEQPRMQYSPEDLVRSTKPITLATAKAVAAGNSCRQEDIIVAANMGRKAISDMLTVCKGTAYAAETMELRNRTLAAGDAVASHYRELLQSVLVVIARGGTTDARQALPPVSRGIAQSVTELVAVAELLKGTDWVDPDDLTVIAENELHGAAASIDAAAKKLASLRPRKTSSTSVKEADENMNFDEMILEAAKSIAAATSALVKAASAAQRELIDLGKVSRRPRSSSDDGQWSEGLVSAARLVAAATHSLVESANALVQGLSSEEKLISSAKQVASSTAQLLVACKVKADPDAPSTKRLQAAGNAVKRATDNLVRAAQQALQQEEERSLVLNRRMVGGIAQEINARSEVLRIERQLEEARGRLTAIRQAKYRLKGSGGPSDGGATSSDTENEAGYGSGYESFTRYEARSFDSSIQSSPGTAHHQQQSLFNSSVTNGVQAQSPSSTLKANGPSTSGISPLNLERQFYSAERKLSTQSQHRKVSSSSFSSKAGGPPSPSGSPPPPPPPPLPHVSSLIDHSGMSNSFASSSSVVSHGYNSLPSHLPPPPPRMDLSHYGETDIERTLHQSSQRVERTVTMTSSSSSSKSFHMEKS